MKRDSRLAGLSADHHRALVLARRLESGAGDVAELRASFDRELEPHFALEEDVLLPALRQIGEVALSRRTKEEHDHLRSALRRVEAGELTALKDFASALATHVRFEERELFPACEEHLPSTTLDQVEKRHPHGRSSKK